DTRSLKSLDIFSVHGFPVGLIQCESNFLGIMEPNKNICIGSGGWVNIIEKFRKAKSYCDKPFEVKHHGHKKELIPIKGEWIGDRLYGSNTGDGRIVDISCKDASSTNIPTASLDAVFTDPPYFGNVQYAELMDFCYVWLRRLVGKTSRAFDAHSTRNPDELTGNENMNRGLEHFTDGLSSTFQRMTRALKPGSPLAFTYHHNQFEAYYPVAIAILDSGLTCSASLPCPAEMSASIHIKGTESSIIDTVFVCRSVGTIRKEQLAESPAEVARLVEDDLNNLKAGNVKPSRGDIRCITYGHLIRLSIWSLRHGWNKSEKTTTRIAKLASWLQNFGGWPQVAQHINSTNTMPEKELMLVAHENVTKYGDENDSVPF
ncbi:MAG: DNA methylase, partial [Bacteroidota bacterium]